MGSPQNVLMTSGLDRLFHEMVAAALSPLGWYVLDFEKANRQSENTAEIALIFYSGTAETVLSEVNRIRAKAPAIKLVLLGGAQTDADILRFVEAGVSACVAGDQSLAEFTATIEMVRNNRAPSSGRLTQLVIGGIGRLSRQREVRPEVRLTRRESEILRLVGTGLSNKEIAEHLKIAPNTVKNHVHHVLEKLKVRSRHEASWLQSRMPRGFPLAG